MSESTNYAKFQTQNPIVRRLIDRFYASVSELVADLEPGSVLDAGCGEGETLVRLAPWLPADLCAVDVDETATEFTRRRVPDADVRQASVYKLPFPDDRFDVVFCLEVLEHLEDPVAALGELARVCRGTVVMSVPHEPWFRIGSLLRGNYVTSLGNHPEHVNHWNRSSFNHLIETRTGPAAVTRSFPWLLATCRPRSDARSADRSLTAPTALAASRQGSGRSGRG